jgi:hypothetical protein
MACDSGEARPAFVPGSTRDDMQAFRTIRRWRTVTVLTIAILAVMGLLTMSLSTVFALGGR